MSELLNLLDRITESDPDPVRRKDMKPDEIELADLIVKAGYLIKTTATVNAKDKAYGIQHSGRVYHKRLKQRCLDRNANHD